MKAITFFVIQCMLSVNSQWAPSQWMNSCAGQMDGMVFPDPDNCDAFIQCQRGNALMLNCRPGTSFDLTLYYCVPSHTTDCGQRRQQNVPVPPQIIDSPPTSIEHHSVCRDQRNGAIIPNPQNCRAFIECQQNLRLDRECQSGELFDERSGVCLSDFAVDCGTRRISPTSDGAIRNVCGNQGNGVRVPDPRDCQRYFVCFDNQGTEEECRAGDLFESNLRRCVNAGVVNCAGRPRINRDSIAPPRGDGPISEAICAGLPTGTRISNPLDCQRYFECRNGQRVDVVCPSNQSFDLGSNQCRPSSTVNCGSRGGSNPNSQRSSACFGQPNGQRVANPNNCRAFFECRAHAQIDRNCEEGNLFDSQLETCLPANLVRCGTRRIPPSDSNHGSPEDFFAPCPRTGVVFRSHPHDCQRYFICSEGTLISHTCAQGILFNPDTLQCDFPQNVQCRLSRIAVPQTPILPDCSSGANYFPNLVNCKQYYRCINNLPQLMDCQNGHLWNNIKMKCEKSDSEICARDFDAFKGAFVYSKPYEDEKKG